VVAVLFHIVVSSPSYSLDAPLIVWGFGLVLVLVLVLVVLD
jgi:hypothetical protein